MANRPPHGYYNREHEEYVRGYFERVSEGYDGTAEYLFDAIYEILGEFSHDHPHTRVFADEFFAAVNLYQDGEAWTLDEAFGVKDARKGKWKSRFRYQMKNAWEIYAEIQQLMQAGKSKTAARDEIADSLDKDKDLIDEAYDFVLQTLKRNKM